MTSQPPFNVWEGVFKSFQEAGGNLNSFFAFLLRKEQYAMEKNNEIEQFQSEEYKDRALDIYTRLNQSYINSQNEVFHV